MQTDTFMSDSQDVHTGHNSQPGPSAPLIIERFLRDRASIWQQIQQGYGLNGLLRQMLISSAVSLFCYGLVMGISHSILQALSSAIKLPILYLLTLAICLPTFYLFNLLYGGRLAVRQVLALGVSTITVSSALTLAFAPITLFFLITAKGYYFFVLLNNIILAITGVIGLQFLVGGIKSINDLEQARQAPPAPEAYGPPAPHAAKQQASKPADTANMPLLRIWLFLYAIVGTQLAWTLRPFVGSPGEPFALFRNIEGNFYEAVVDIIFHMLLSRGGI